MILPGEPQAQIYKPVPQVASRQPPQDADDYLAKQTKADPLDNQICQYAGDGTHHNPGQNIPKHNKLLSNTMMPGTRESITDPG